MDTLGQHLLVEYEGCERRVLNCPQAIEAAMREAAEAAAAAIVDTIFRRFSPQGVSGVVVVEESHLSIHTWPEYGYAAVDFYTCGDCLPLRAHAVLRKHLRSSRAEWLVVRRGRRGRQRLLQVEQHQVEAHAATAVSTNVDRPHTPVNRDIGKESTEDREGAG